MASVSEAFSINNIFDFIFFSFIDLILGSIVNVNRDMSLSLIVGGLIFNSSCSIGLGSKVTGLAKLPCVVIGDYVIGSILDAIGQSLFSSDLIAGVSPWVVEATAPGIVDRLSVYEPLQTGLVSVDSMVPIGRGQRELIVGDRQVGKTSIGIDSILNQRFEQVYALYQPVGQKASSILQVFLSFVCRDSMFYVSMLVATASSSAVSQFMSVYSGCSLGEYFMFVRESAVFITMDDLAQHAMACREIYLLLRRPPGREAYPGEIFFVHSRLLERSSKLSFTLGGGSITAFPVIETLASDVSSYITTNVISITDGQIFLSQELFISGQRPSVDVGLSVSRVGSAAQWKGMKLVAGSFKLELAQYVELQAFSQFSSDLGKETISRLDRGMLLVELLKQNNGSPMLLSSQVGILSLSSGGWFKSLFLDSVF